MGDYYFEISRDDTVAEGRARALKRMHAILMQLPQPLPDGANGFLHGLNSGWVVSQVIGLADADEVEAFLPPRSDEVLNAVPYGPDDIIHPELDALTPDDIPDGVWFDSWMGLKRHFYFFEQQGIEMPERSTLVWLGFLRGELEGGSFSQEEYDKLRSMLPPVKDDLTPLVAATA